MQEHSKQYDDYMRSDAWEAKRQQRIEIDGYKCVMCGRPTQTMKKINVHHISYRNLGNENVLTDLCTLCPTCHKHIHNYYNRRRGA